MSIQLRKSKLPTIPGSEVTGESKEETYWKVSISRVQKRDCVQSMFPQILMQERWRISQLQNCRSQQSACVSSAEPS